MVTLPRGALGEHRRAGELDFAGRLRCRVRQRRETTGAVGRCGTDYTAGAASLPPATSFNERHTVNRRAVMTDGAAALHRVFATLYQTGRRATPENYGLSNSGNFNTLVG